MGQPGQPGMTGMGQPGMAQPGMPGMSQPGMPGVGQPGMPGTVAPGMPGASQAGMPGMGAPGAPGMNQPGVPGMGGPATMPPPGGYPATQQFAGWNGSYVGNGGQLTMFVQPNQQGYYEGYFDVSGQGRFPLQAQAQGTVLEGVYVVNGGQYGFYAEFYDGYVYLIEEIDGSEYMLEPAGYAAPGSSQWPIQFPSQQPGIPGDAP